MLAAVGALLFLLAAWFAVRAWQEWPRDDEIDATMGWVEEEVQARLREIQALGERVKRERRP